MRDPSGLLQHSLGRLAATSAQVPPKIDMLEIQQGPCEILDSAGSYQERKYAVFIAIGTQSELNLMLHPLGLDRTRCEQDHEPIATVKCTADRVKPFLRSSQAVRAVPARDSELA